MYGDAADIYIDNDRNGSMDDLNRDGRVNIRDARVLEEGVNRVERAHPALMGEQACIRAWGTDLSFTSTRAASARDGSDPETANEQEPRVERDGGGGCR